MEEKVELNNFDIGMLLALVIDYLKSDNKGYSPIHGMLHDKLLKISKQNCKENPE